MDWSKAKNILIIALVVTNLFLIYNIEKDIFKESASSMVYDRNITDVIEILKEKNIKIETEVPKTVLELPVLNVEYKTYNEKEVKEKFHIKNEDTRSINVVNHKTIVYEDKDDQIHIKNIDEEKAIHEAKIFIQKYDFMNGDVVYDKTIKTPEGYHVCFKQKYKGQFLEISYMHIIVNESGVKRFERLWLKPLKFDENKKEIIPATKALLKSMEEIQNNDEQVRIKKIDLGYWFDPSHISLTNSGNIKSGTAIPAWRLTLKDGNIVFIPAYENY
ncbi:two-component system regulatory protein YycI [Inediibacterium massiliense]|uniref:two-component system regulatory protein YycI n=1 Tax=Inediibacterium massiliense TaxID=1658111 RepID=UPI0006B5500E|nr:two-component system regulatory protein YycI [Inediibacterium massiliense]